MRISKAKFLVHLLFISAVLCGGCKNSSTIKSAVITSVGDYPSPDGNYVAHITIDGQRVVNYSITSRESSQIMDSGKAGNSFMKFFMCWDQSNDFFIDSEDTSRIL